MKPPKANALGLAPFTVGAVLGQECESCGTDLYAETLYLPGSRVVAETTCQRCGQHYLADAPTGFGLICPDLYRPDNGTFAGDAVFPFWRSWSERFYRSRTGMDLGIEVSLFKPVAMPLILNCLDPIYGHMVKRLFHATAYLDRYPDRDLILVLPGNLRWLVPDGVAGVIELDWPNGAHSSWCTDLERTVEDFVARYPATAFCQTIPTLHTSEIDIARFTRVQPFDRMNWSLKGAAPTICYIWRDTRFWGDSETAQCQNIEALYSALSGWFPDMRFIVAGVSRHGVRFSDPVENAVIQELDAEAERRLIRLYAGSHVVVGVHGSNMILPSAHAGATLELVPTGRWHNAWTASQFRSVQDNAATSFFHRFLPLATVTGDIADLIRATCSFAPRFAVLGMRESTRFETADPQNNLDRRLHFPPL